MFTKKHRSIPVNERQEVGHGKQASSGSSYDNLHHKSPYYRKPPNFYKLLKAYPQLFSEIQGVNSVDITKTKKTQNDHGHGTVSTEPEMQIGDDEITFTDQNVGLWVDHKSKRCRINWKNIAVMKALTKAMLLNDFQLTVNFPDNYLIPPLPNRINYLCWLSDLQEACQAMVGNNSSQLTVVDIGTGSSVIYPLLGHSLFGFKFIGSDVNDEALNFAANNLSQNKDKVQVQGVDQIRLARVQDSNALQQFLQHHILSSTGGSSVITKREDLDLLSLLGPIRTLFHALGDSFYYRLMDCHHHWNSGSRIDNVEQASKSRRREDDPGSSTMDLEDGPPTQTETAIRWKPLVFAVMTNPPFYDLDEQIQENDETICTGNPIEMKTMGGECAFIAGMIADSLVLKESVLWYTAMVGKKSSLTTLKHILLQEGIPREQIFVREFAQGVTYRWGLAWTFSPEAAALNAAFEIVRPQSQHMAVSAKGMTVGGPKQPNLTVSCTYEDFVKTTLREELLQVYQQQNIISNSFSRGIVTNEELPSNILFPSVIGRLRVVSNELEKALQSLNLQTHGSELSFISTQGKFQSASVQGCLKLVPLQWLDNIESDPFVCKIQFSVVYQQDSISKPLVDIELVVNIVQLDEGGAIEIRSVIRIMKSQCSEGLASRIQHCIKDQFENEFARGNRRWRRLLAKLSEPKTDAV